MPYNTIIELLHEAHTMVLCIDDIHKRLYLLIKLMDIVEELLRIKSARMMSKAKKAGTNGAGSADYSDYSDYTDVSDDSDSSVGMAME